MRNQIAKLMVGVNFESPPMLQLVIMLVKFLTGFFKC